MVAIVSSNTLGFSSNSLGQRGVMGPAQSGNNGEQVAVNIATGNLVLQDRDELVAGVGLDIATVRTYNSQGVLVDNQRQNWSRGFYAQAIVLQQGVLNQAGSSLLRTERDGAQSLFVYNAGKGAYVSTDGEGAYNRISVDASGNFTWLEAASGNSMQYDANGRLTRASDASGNLIQYGYSAGGLLTSVTDNGSGAVTLYGYDANGNLTSSATKGSASGALSTRVRYDYDPNSRLLTRVTVDLTPQDNNIADGNTYVTNYSYVDGSANLRQITQSDGSSLAFTWVNVNGQSRVASVTDALNQVTRFAYDAASGSTSVTDALNLVTRYDYDTQGQLLKVSGPQLNGSVPVTSTTYGYNERGDLSQMSDGEGRSVIYEYDAATGDQIRQKDRLGNTVERVYERSQLISERQFVTPASGSTAAGNALTTHYVRDDKGRVRFVISPELRVTEYRYDNLGQRVASLSYGRTYDPALIVLDAARNELDSVKTLAKAAIWVTIQEPRLMQRTDFHYDAHGLLDSSTQYARLDSQGNGVADADMSVTQYVYDQSGQLLQSIAADGNSTVYTWDGLGRMLTSTSQVNGAPQTTINSYASGGSTRSIKLANGLITTSLFDAAGRLTSLQQTDASNKVLSQTRYRYDSDGRLVQTQDATGVTQTTLYDDAGRRAASIDGMGSVTEYRYNAANQLIRTIVRATPLAPALLAALNANPENARLAGTRSNDGVSNPVLIDLGLLAAGDRITRQLYDAAGRLSKTIDAAGAVVSYQYDGANRLLTTTAFAKTLGSSQMAIILGRDQINLVLSPDDPSTLPQLDTANDRTTRRFYDKDGLLRGVLDADLYLTETQYHANGEVALTQRYGKQVLNYVAGATLSQLTPGYSSDDIRSVTLYNAKGQVSAQSDGANYLTKFTYDKNGNLTLSQRFATPLAANLQVWTLPDDPLLAIATSVEDHLTRNRYDNQNRRIESINAEGTVTTYQYDAVGNLLASFTDRVAPEDGGVRGNDRRYDLQGRLTAELSGEGSRQLHTGTPTQNQIDALWRQYGMVYTYDAAGRKTSSTDPNQHTTLYYYDADGRLQSTVNAAGEVTRQDYTVQGELASIRRYASRIDAASLAALQANTRNADAPRQLPILTIDAAKDQFTTFTYDGRGQLQSQSDALGGNSRITYNAFGERETDTRLIATTADPALASGPANTTTSTTTRYAYNKRGLLYTTMLDDGKLNYLGNYTDYDAFGRVKRFQDFGGNVRTTNYDALGRVVKVSDPRLTSTTTWDAFDRVLTQTDGLGNTTSYAYDLASRSMSVTSAEGVKLTTVHNRHGQQASVTDALGKITRFYYDGNGQLLRREDELGGSANGYDQAGLLSWTLDARGTTTRFDYDAANRVLSKTVDPAQRVPGAPAPDANWVALNLTTRYEYDAFGQTLLVTDPNGVVSKTVYDQQGQVKEIIQDYGTGSDKLNLKTSFSYDLRGKTLTVVDASNHTVSYEFDRLGRRISQTAYADGVKLVTRYVYDRNNNVTQVIDANGNRTRYAYDGQNRVTDVIDAAGGVTHSDYDAAGNLTARTRYANAIDLAAVAAFTPALSSTFIKTLLTPDALRDNVDRYVYNKDNQLRFTFDTLGWISETQYDQAGRAWRSIDYKLLNAIATPYTEANLVAATNSYGSGVLQQTTRAFDARNRVVFEIDARGGTTRYQYDANDNLYQRIEFAKGVGPETVLTRPTPAQVLAALAASQAYQAGEFNFALENRNQLMRYDAANRLITTATMFVASRDANAPIHWRIDSRDYDAAGNLIATSSRDHLIDPKTEQEINGTSVLSYSGEGSADSLLKKWQDATPRNFARDHNSRRLYDSANRLIGSATAQGIDATGRVNWAVQAQRYDNAGNLLQTTAYAQPLTSAAAGNVGQAELKSWLQNPLQSATQDNVSQYLYDSANRQIFAINALGVVSQNDYDALGNVVQRITWDTKVTGQIDQAALTRALTPLGKNWSQRGQWLNDGKNHVSATLYDSTSQAVMQIDALGNVVEWQRDALGNVVRTNVYANPVDTALVASKPTLAAVRAGLGNTPQAHVTLQFYDAHSRLRYQIDPGGYATETRYDGLNRATSRYQYVSAQGGISTATSLNQLADLYRYGAGTRFEGWSYDAAGNLSQHDMPFDQGNSASSHYEYTDLHNAWYNVEVQASNIGPGIHDVDTMGHLARLAGPDTHADLATGGPVTNALTRFEYDVYGNLIRQTESTGTNPVYGAPRSVRSYKETDLRTTRYEYDAAGHQIKIIAPAVQVYDATQDATLDNEYATRLANPTTLTTYDTLGRAIINQDVSGQFSYKTYNALGQVTYEIDAAGYVTGYDYDNVGNVTRLTRYADKPQLNPDPVRGLTTDAVAAALQSLGHSQDRSVSTVYDRLGRVVRRIEPQAILTDSAHRTAGAVDGTAAKTTEQFYNGYGQIYRVAEYGVDPQGAVVTQVSNTYLSYDQRGNKVAQVSIVSQRGALETGYLTTWAYNAFGDMAIQKEVASAIELDASVWQNAARLGTGFTAPASQPEDREVRYDYNDRGQKIRETRVNVLAAQSGDISSSALSSRSNVVTQYAYDRTGNLIWTQDSLGRYTISRYNEQGFVVAVLSNYTSGTAPLSVFTRDLRGNILKRTDYANGGTVEWVRESGVLVGRIIAGAASSDDRITTNTWDSQGHLTSTLDAEGHTTNFFYDAAGHQIKQSQVVTNAAFGTQEKKVTLFAYDAVGRLVDSASKDVSEALNPNAALRMAHQTVRYNSFGEIISKSLLVMQGVGGAVVDALSRINYENNQYDNAGHLWKSNAGDGVAKVMQYDLNGRVTTSIRSTDNRIHDLSDVRNLASLDAAGLLRNEMRYDLSGNMVLQTSANAATVVQTFDRWGNVIQRSDPRYTTLYSVFAYNANNQLIQSSTPVNDVSNPERLVDVITTRTGYDALGHSVLTQDGNGNLNAFQYTSSDKVAQEMHADGGTVRYGYNLFGERTSQSVALDATHNRLTRYGYNHLGAMTESRTEAVEVFYALPDTFHEALPVGSELLMRLYALLLGSAPNRSIIDAQAPQTATESGMVALANSIINGTPGQFPPGMSDRDFIIKLYQTGLNRMPAEAEIAGWLAIGNPPPLAAGATTVLQLYAALLGRGPDRATLDTLSPQAGNDDANTDLANQILQMNPQLANLSDRDFVIKLYQNGLNRTPAEPEISYWLGTLTPYGASRASLVSSFIHVAQANNSDGDAFNAKVLALRAPLTTPAAAPTHAALAVSFMNVTNAINSDGDTFNAKVQDLLYQARPLAGQGGNVYLYNKGMQELVERYQYDELGRRIQSTNGAGETTRVQYDLEGNAIRNRDAFGYDTLSYFDSEHHKVKEIDANRHYQHWAYDGAGRMAQSNNMAGAVTDYTYNGAGQLVLQKVRLTDAQIAANEKAQELRFGYTGEYQTSIDDITLGVHSTFQYDLAGNRIGELVQDKDNKVLQNNVITFDAANRMASVHNDIFNVTYRYDRNSNRTMVHTVYNDNKGQHQDLTQFTQYDVQNRAIVVNNANNDANAIVYTKDTHQITYDLSGNRTSDRYVGKSLIESLTTIETYSYDAAGRLVSTMRDDTVQVDLRKYDAAGRTVRSGAVGYVNRDTAPEGNNNGPADVGTYYDILGLTQDYTLSVYDNSHIIRQKTFFLNTSLEDGHGAPGNDTYFLDGEHTGYDKVGNVLGYTVVNYNQLRNYFKTYYTVANGYREDFSLASNPDHARKTSFSYDVNGNRVGIYDITGNITTHSRGFGYDNEGHILRKYDDVAVHTLIANGIQLGTDDAASVGDLANPYESVNGRSLTSGPGYYSVQNDGETWQSIAKNAWGDSKLWYAIAEINPAGPVHKGDLVKLPARPNTINNDASTFKPYDPSGLVGSTVPNLPSAYKDNCGGYGRILSTIVTIIVQIVVTRISYSPTLGAAAGNVAGQFVGNLAGSQDGFSVKSFATSVAASYISQGVNNGSTSAFQAAVVSNLATQSLAVATHQQQGFSWRSTVAAGIGAEVGEYIGGKLDVNGTAPSTLDGKDFGLRLLKSFAAGAATAIAGGGRVSVVQVATDAFGNALGESLAGAANDAATRARYANVENQSQAETNRLDRYEREAQDNEFAALAGSSPQLAALGDDRSGVYGPKGYKSAGIGSQYTTAGGGIATVSAGDAVAVRSFRDGDAKGYLNEMDLPPGASVPKPITLIRADGSEFGGWSYAVNGKVVNTNFVLTAPASAGVPVFDSATMGPSFEEAAATAPVVAGIQLPNTFAEANEQAQRAEWAASDAHINRQAEAARKNSIAYYTQGQYDEVPQPVFKTGSASPAVTQALFDEVINTPVGPQMVARDIEAEASFRYEQMRAANTLAIGSMGVFGVGGAYGRFTGASEADIAATNERSAQGFSALAALAGAQGSRIQVPSVNNRPNLISIGARNYRAPNGFSNIRYLNAPIGIPNTRFSAGSVAGPYSSANSFKPINSSLGANSGSNVAYRALTSTDAAALGRGAGLSAKAPNGTWTAAEHVANTGPGAGGAAMNSPWISTSRRLDVAKAYDSGYGVIEIDLNKVGSFQTEVWKTAPRVNGVAGLPYHRSIWAQEVTIHQQIPANAIKGFVP